MMSCDTCPTSSRLNNKEVGTQTEDANPKVKLKELKAKLSRRNSQINNLKVKLRNAERESEMLKEDLEREKRRSGRL